MNLSRQAIDESYLICREMGRRSGSNLRYGYFLLPREKRRAMEALYAFMRHTDDLVDGPPSACPRQEALAAWRLAVSLALSGDIGEAGSDVTANSRAPAPAESLLPALADTVDRFHIPHEVISAVIDGVEMDLAGRRYETFDDLRPYCERVASSVGLACIHIWGFRGPEAVPLARSMGIALQLTNILRDLTEDARADRIYLPFADLRLCNYSLDDLRSGVDDERFRRLMAIEVARAEEFYRHGTELIDWLEADGRRIFGLMTATYHELLRRIARQPAEIFWWRTRLGGLKRLQLVARWTLLPVRKDAL